MARVCRRQRHPTNDVGGLVVGEVVYCLRVTFELSRVLYEGCNARVATRDTVAERPGQSTHARHAHARSVRPQLG